MNCVFGVGGFASVGCCFSEFELRFLPRKIPIAVPPTLPINRVPITIASTGEVFRRLTGLRRTDLFVSGRPSVTIFVFASGVADVES